MVVVVMIMVTMTAMMKTTSIALGRGVLKGQTASRLISRLSLYGSLGPDT